MTAYYNEIDPYAAEWLRSLIRSGHIADGVVDERSISDVRPNELYEFTQCHFFAGIGVWSYALRQAGWDDDRPVWTGSCPCQPFSGAGTRKGFADERHLWPHWFHLIEECRPETIFGEQVASKDGLRWIDLVQADMEGADYAIGAFDMCAAGFGAPHIRQRLWFVADTDNPRSQRWVSRGKDSGRQDQHRHVGCGSTTDGMGDTDNIGSQGSSQTRVGEEVENSSHEPARADADVGMAYAQSEQGSPDDNRGEPRKVSEPQQVQSGGSGSGLGGVDDTECYRWHEIGVGDNPEYDWEQFDADVEDGRMGNPEHDGQPSTQEPRSDDQDASNDAQEQIVPVQSEGAGVSRDDRSSVGGEGGSTAEADPDETNGFWGDADWLLCRDGKWRPVEPSTFPLVNGATARVGRLRAYGNAITAQVAQGLIESYMEHNYEG
jgi:DNA (cytosine-5)-methyltransferase 1